jgi:hypothetical protein
LAYQKLTGVLRWGVHGAHGTSHGEVNESSRAAVAGHPTAEASSAGSGADVSPSEREEFLFDIDLILDGVQAMIDRAD